MPPLLQVVLLVLLAAVFVSASLAIWLQRAPRRATLSTLKVAVASAKTSAPARPATLLVVPVPTTANPSSDGKQSALQRLASSVVDAIATLARRLSPPTYLIGVQRRLTLAGKDRTEDLNQFLALRLTSLIRIIPAFLLLSLSSLPGLYRRLTFFFFAALFFSARKPLKQGGK